MLLSNPRLLSITIVLFSFFSKVLGYFPFTSISSVVYKRVFSAWWKSVSQIFSFSPSSFFLVTFALMKRLVRTYFSSNASMRVSLGFNNRLHNSPLSNYSRSKCRRLINFGVVSGDKLKCIDERPIYKADCRAWATAQPSSSNKQLWR